MLEKVGDTRISLIGQSHMTWDDFHSQILWISEKAAEDCIAIKDTSPSSGEHTANITGAQLNYLC